MLKITFLGAGSTIFAKNVLGDIMLTDSLHNVEIALYDIDKIRLKESELLINALNKNCNENRATIKSYLGVKNRREALKDADFIINAVQIGGYEPSTVIDFEIPKKYGLYQTIGDTLGIGGIMRALRTIPVLREFAEDIEAVCPNAWFLNYTNPMAMLTGYMQRHTNVKTIGLCHSVQVCSKSLLKSLDMDADGVTDKIAGINHMAWLLEVRDRNGNDLYPEIKKRIIEKNLHKVCFEYIKRLGYFCTEGSVHNAEYNPWFIKPNRPDIIEKYDVMLDEYPRRCLKQIEDWKKQRDEILNSKNITHEMSREYASKIITAMVTNVPYKFGGNVINTGIIPNLPQNACVEVPCIADANGITPTFIGDLPEQLASLNRTNINPQLLTIEAAVSKSREKVYQAAMLDPLTATTLSIDEIVSMCDELIDAHNKTDFKVLY